MGKNRSKIVFYGDVLIDLTPDTITPEKMLLGYTAHDAAGNEITGTCDYDVNSGDATVKVGEQLEGTISYARGKKVIGTMPNNGAVTLEISNVDDEIKIPQGYHDGSGVVKIADAEKLKIVANAIKKGITILGREGTLEPSSSIKVHTKTVTPGKTEQVVLPDAGYDYLSQVTVAAVPYVETDNSAGGKTVTIGG